jgi:hypothetical protein
VAQYGAVAAVALVFAVAWLWRWVVLDDRLSGDDHWALWMAATMLEGDRALRDFVEPGTPLQGLVSAAVQYVVGYRVIGEVVLGTTLTAAGIAVAFGLAWRASGSAAIATALTALVVLLVATIKLYSYPKVFVYPLGLWLAWRYIDRPSRGRALALAVGVALAFLYRHDHGAYLAAGAAVAVLAAHAGAGPRQALWSLSRVGLATVCLLGPYFAIVQANEGLVPYFRERMALASRFDQDGVHRPPLVLDRSAPLLVAVAPQAPAAIQVNWTPGLTPAVRAELERRYTLAPPTTVRQDGWSVYRLADISTANLQALVSDLHIAEVDGVIGSFRDGFALDDYHSAPFPIGVRWKSALPDDRRALLEHRYGLSDPELDSSDATRQLWRYRIRDRRVENVTALHDDDEVDAVLGVHGVRIPVEVALRKRPDVGPYVLLRWTASVDASARAAAERRYQLMYGDIDEGDPTRTIWQYQIADRSIENVTALATDPRVTYTDQIEPGDAPGTYQARPWTPPGGADIRVRWHPRVSPDARARLERRYRLQPPVDALVPYALLDGRPANVRALLADSYVIATTGLDRDRGRIAADSWLATVDRNLGLSRLRPLPWLIRRDNAGPWAYWVSVALPYLVLAVLAADVLRRRVALPGEFDARKMLVAAILAILVNLFLLKRLGYMGDHANLALILGAWLLSRAVGGRTLRRVARSTAGIVAVVLLVTTTASIVVYADVPTIVARYKLSEPVSAQWETSRAKFQRFSISPAIDGYAPAGVTGDRAVIRYLHECTRPGDRIWVTTDEYTIPYYTERRILGHLFWANGFLASPEHQRQTIDRLERDQVPVIFSMGGATALDKLDLYPEVRNYVARRYTKAAAVAQDSQSGKMIWLLFDSRRQATGYYASLQLPCFS